MPSEYHMNARFVQVLGGAGAQDRAYAHIKEEILSLRLAPSQRLGAMDFSESLGISRTPVREALSRLEQDGLVSRETGGGFFVRGMTLREIVDFYRVREILEVAAALEALPRLTPNVLEQLQNCLSRAAELLEPAKFSEFVLSNRDFHARILEASGNVALQTVMVPVSYRVRIVGAMLIKLHAPRQREVLEENTRILEALRAPDSARVEDAVRTHVRQAREYARDLLGSDPEKLVVGASQVS